MDGAIHVKVFGVHVPKGKSVPLKAEESDKNMETFQITQVALGENAGSKRSVVLINDGNNEWVIGSLVPGKCEQFQTDYMGRQSVTLRHTGDGDVWVSGFKTITSLDDFEDDEEEEEEEDEEDEEGQELTEEQKQMIEDLIRSGKLGKPADDEDDDDDEEGDEDDEDDDEDGLNGQEFDGMDEDDDEEDDEDEDEEEDDEEDDDDDEEEEEPPQKAGKRTAPALEKGSKKVKTEEAADPGAYEAALKKYIKQNGPQTLSALGSKVPGKPPAMKLKTFLQQRPKVFKMQPNGAVALA